MGAHRATNVQHQRGASLPLQETNLPRPLGSHLPFPMNVNAPDQSDPHLRQHPQRRQQAQPTFDPPSRAHQRRNSLPSVIYGAHDAAATTSGPTWTDPSKRLTSADDQDLRLPVSDNEIGVAVTSGSTNPNRRSRSAGALYDLVRGGRTGDERRNMSDEIRYWREQHPSRPVTAEQAGFVVASVVGEDVEHAERAGEGPGLEHPASTREDLRNVGETPRPLETDPTPSAPALETEATTTAKEFDVPHGTVEERVTRLEHEIAGLETSVQKLIGRTNRRTIILQEVPQDLRPESSHSVGEDPVVAAPAPSTTTSTTPHIAHTLSPAPPLFPPPSPNQTPDHYHPYYYHHPHPHRQSETTTTATGDRHSAAYATSLPSSLPHSHSHSHSQAPISPDAVSGLYMLLSHERTARKNMEAYMQALQRELLEMRCILAAAATATSAASAQPQPQSQPHPHPQPQQARYHGLRTTDPSLHHNHHHHHHHHHDATKRDTVSRFSHFDSGDEDTDAGTGTGPGTGTGTGTRASASGSDIVPAAPVAVNRMSAGFGSIAEKASSPSTTGGMTDGEDVFETPMEDDGSDDGGAGRYGGFGAWRGAAGGAGGVPTTTTTTKAGGEMKARHVGMV